MHIIFMCVTWVHTIVAEHFFKPLVSIDDLKSCCHAVEDRPDPTFVSSEHVCESRAHVLIHDTYVLMTRDGAHALTYTHAE